MASSLHEALTGNRLVAEAMHGTVCIGVAFDTAWKTYDNGTLMPFTHYTTSSGVQCYIYHYGSGWFFHDSGLVLTCEHVRRACRRDIMTYQNAAAAPAAGAAATPAPAPAAIHVVVVCPCEGPTRNLDWSKAWKAEVVAHTANWDPRDTSSFCRLRVRRGRSFCEEHERYCTVSTTDCSPDAPEDASALPPVQTLPDHDDAAVLCIKSSLSTGAAVAQPITVGATPLKVLHLSETCLQNVNHALQELASLGFPPAGGRQTATPTPVMFSGNFDATFLKLTGSEMMPGHSGGPLVTMSGVVVGWNVRHQPQIKLYSHCKMITASLKVASSSHFPRERPGTTCLQPTPRRRRMWSKCVQASQPSEPRLQRRQRRLQRRQRRLQRRQRRLQRRQRRLQHHQQRLWLRQRRLQRHQQRLQLRQRRLQHRQQRQQPARPGKQSLWAAQGAAIAEQGAQQAAWYAGQSAQDAAWSETAATYSATHAVGAAQSAAAAQQGAQQAAWCAQLGAQGAGSSATAAAGAAADAVGAASNASASANAAGTLAYVGALQATAQIAQVQVLAVQQLMGSVPYLNPAAPLSGAPLQFASMSTALQPTALQLPAAPPGASALAPAMQPKKVVIQTSGDIAAISMPAQQDEFKSALASELELTLPPDIVTLEPDARTVQITRREATIALSGLTPIEGRGVEAFVAERLAVSAADLRVIFVPGSLYLHIAGPAWAMMLLTQFFVAGDDGIRQLLLARGLGEPGLLLLSLRLPKLLALSSRPPNRSGLGWSRARRRRRLFSMRRSRRLPKLLALSSRPPNRSGLGWIRARRRRRLFSMRRSRATSSPSSASWSRG